MQRMPLHLRELLNPLLWMDLILLELPVVLHNEEVLSLKPFIDLMWLLAVGLPNTSVHMDGEVLTPLGVAVTHHRGLLVKAMKLG